MKRESKRETKIGKWFLGLADKWNTLLYDELKRKNKEDERKIHK